MSTPRHRILDKTVAKRLHWVFIHVYRERESMSIATDIQSKVDESARPKACKLGLLLDGHLLVEDDRDALLFAVKSVRDERDLPQNDRTFSIQWLTDVINQNGYNIGKTVVSEHVRESCACDNN